MVWAAAAIGGLALSASASGAPVMSLDKDTGGTVLAGASSDVTLTASNSAPDPGVVGDWGYNTSFRDVLPEGVSYVPGSASVPPTSVLANLPGAGETTLIWENATDVSPQSSFALTYEVQHALQTVDNEAPDDPATFRVGQSYPNAAGVFVNSDPRFVPDFDANGAPSGDITQSASDSAATAIVPFDLRITEPNAEGEILRGVHDHQTTYTFELENNPTLATSNARVYAAFPAGLELLGCGGPGMDNTTDAPTSPVGDPDEYEGSGPITAPPLADCPTFTVVDTISGTSWDPDGAGPEPPLDLPEGGVWTVFGFDVGSLAPGETATFDVLAGVPIRENTETWSAGAAPPADGSQSASLDNNSGPETTDEQSLTARGLALGEYSGPVDPSAPPPQRDLASLQRTAEDLSVHKSVDLPSIAQGQTSVWSMLLETSEYRRVENVEVTDTLPDGQCPLGGDNFADDFPGAGEIPVSNPECATVAGSQPTVDGVDIAGEGYTDATENADGTWTLTWDETTLTQLGTISPSSAVTITFPSRTRTNYQEGFLDAAPILSHDSWSNRVDVAGPGFRDATSYTGPPPLPGDELDGQTDVDSSGAGQAAPGPSIRKRVAERASILGGEACSDAGVVYGSGPGAYGPGDRICWELRVDFPPALDTDLTPFRDFIPPGHQYVPGSSTPTADNTIALTPGDPVLDGDSLTWTPVSGSVDAGSEVFEVVFETRIMDPDAGSAFDISSNLFKYAAINTTSSTFPKRAQADIEWAAPELDLVKGVADVENQPPGGNGPNVDGLTVEPGDIVTYRVDVENIGSRDAVNAEVVDVLPVDVTGAITSISNGGAVEADVDGALDGNGDGDPGNDRGIRWTGLGVPTISPITLTYDAQMPSPPLSSGSELDNRAGVRRYEVENNSGDPNTVYVPAGNIDPPPGLPPNAPSADDPSNVFISPASLAKDRVTSVDEAGNAAADQVTIGEEISYTVTATFPANTTVFQPQIADDFEQTQISVSNVQLAPGGANDGGWRLQDNGDTIVVDRNPTPPGNDAFSPGAFDESLTLTYTGTVLDVAINDATASNPIDNDAVLTWNLDDGSNPASPQTARTTTDIVEPDIEITKGASPAGSRFVGDTVLFSVLLSNPAGRSTAHDVAFTDVIPPGLTYVPGSATLFQLGGSTGSITDPATSPNATGITLGPGQSAAISYQATVTASAGSALTNSARATAESLPSGGRTPASAPANNDNPGFYDETTAATVNVIELTLDKDQSTAVTEAGNNANTEAAIGEEVVYTLTSVIPADTTVYPHSTIGAFIGDEIPDNLTLTDAVATFSDATVGTIGPIAPGASDTSGDWALSSSGTGNRTVELSLGAGTSYFSGASDVTVTVAIRGTADDEQQNTNGVTFGNTARLAFDTDDPSGAPQSLTDTGSTSGTIVEPDLEIQKANDATGEVAAGGTITYTVTMTNAGTSTAHATALDDVLPSGLTFAAVLGNEVAGVPVGSAIHDGSPTGGSVSWLIPTLEPGQTAVLVYTATIRPSVGAGTVLDNVATVTGESLAANVDPGNNRRTSASGLGADPPNVNPDFYEEQAASSVTVASASVTKQVTTSVGDGPGGNELATEATIGERVTYTLTGTIAADTTIRPHGAIPAFIGDTVPDTLTFVGARAVVGEPGFPEIGPIEPGGSASQGDWTLTSSGVEHRTVGLALAPGTSYTTPPQLDVEVTITIEATVDDEPANVAGAFFDNEATLAWSDGGGVDRAGSAAARTRVVEPKITVDKSNDATSPRQAGDTVGFTVAVANGTGADVSAAESASLSDGLPSGLTLVAGSLSGSGPGSPPAPGYDPATRRITWSGLRLGPGESATLTYRATVDAGFTGAVTNTASAQARSLAEGLGRPYAAQASSNIGVVAPASPAQTPLAAAPSQAVQACDAGGSVRVSRRVVRVGVRTNLLVVVRDADGTPVAGHPVQLAKERGKARMRPRRKLTDRNGRARFVIRAANPPARLRARGAECGNSPRVVARRTATCRGVRSSHRQVDVRRATRVRVVMRNGRQPIQATRVIARGAGVRAAGRTNARGVATLRIAPTKAGVVRVQAPRALSCSLRIGAAEVESQGAGLTG